MYTYIRAVAISRSTGSQWESVDIAQLRLTDLFRRYRGCVIELSNPVLPGHVYFDILTFIEELSASTRTLSQFFLDIGNRTLPTVDTLPSSRIVYAKYSDAIQAGYKINPINIGQSPIDNELFDNCDDLKITKRQPPTDMRLLHSHCLITVNGYFHQTDADLQGNEAYVIDGAKSMKKSRLNQLGILSFLDIGSLEKVQITDDMITALEVDGGLKNRAHFTLNRDLTNKTVLLVLGGYLLFQQDSIFWQTGEKSFTISINSMPFLERFYESNLYLNFETLNLTSNISDSSAVNRDEFFSDAVLRRYFTLSQSFFVIIDTPSLLTNKYTLHHCYMPGMFTAYQEPVSPLFVNYGKVADYWKLEEETHWSVTITDTFFKNFVISYENKLYTPTLISQLTPGKTSYVSHGYLLEIGAYKDN